MTGEEQLAIHAIQAAFSIIIDKTCLQDNEECRDILFRIEKDLYSLHSILIEQDRAASAALEQQRREILNKLNAVVEQEKQKANQILPPGMTFTKKE